MHWLWVNLCMVIFEGVAFDLSHNEWMTCRYLSTHTVYRYKIQLFHYLGGMAINIGKWIMENIIVMRFLTEQKDWKLLDNQPTHASCHHQMHTDWPSAIGWEILSEVSEIWSRACVFTQHCFFLPPHACRLEFKMPLPPATTKKDPGLHKGNTGSESPE